MLETIIKFKSIYVCGPLDIPTRSKSNIIIAILLLALRSDHQGFTFTPLHTLTVDSMYCDVVLIVCQEASQFLLCDIAAGCDVQNSPIWGLGRIGGNSDEVEISTVSITQCPAHSDIHSSTDISREANTRECWNRGET